MNLILGTGSNVGDRRIYLETAQQELAQHFTLIEASSIYENPAVDYLDQPDFLNQILEYELPQFLDPIDGLRLIKQIEQKMGRKKSFDKGPREIDIDIIFWGPKMLHSLELTLPHPNWKQRPFVYKLIKELKSYQRGVYHGFFSNK
jgi:2-amino-4-hydroxy-6-hydroxymethyldihydropteridine diphosphokinase